MVMSNAIWQSWNAGDSATAAATGSIMIVGMGIIFYSLLRAFPKIFGSKL